MSPYIEHDQSNPNKMSVEPLIGCSNESFALPNSSPVPYWTVRLDGVAKSDDKVVRYDVSENSSNGE